MVWKNMINISKYNLFNFFVIITKYMILSSEPIFCNIFIVWIMISFFFLLIPITDRIFLFCLFMNFNFFPISFIFNTLDLKFNLVFIILNMDFNDFGNLLICLLTFDLIYSLLTKNNFCLPSVYSTKIQFKKCSNITIKFLNFILNF